MDNPSSEPSIDTNEAGALFSSLMGGEPLEKDTADPESAAERLLTEEAGNEPEEVDQDASNDPDEVRIPIDMDGKIVEFTKAEIAERIKDGLRQSDYTKKTMELAEAKRETLAKTNDAEVKANAAQQERQEYTQKLNNYAIQLQGTLQEQSQINWQQLLETDPVEYLKQERTFTQRQAALQQAQQEQGRIYQQQQAEQADSVKQYISKQQQELLAKLPEWKDTAKLKAETSAIKEYLSAQGFNADELNNVVDHRNVIAYMKAMKYDALLARAGNATKRVAAVPAKVERPGGGTPQQTGTADAMKRLSRSGSVDDAAALFSRMF